MREDLRPYWVKRLHLGARAAYCRHYLRPHFAELGPHTVTMKPWYIEVSGPNISVGAAATLIADSDQRIRLSVWGRNPGEGEIVIGDYALLTPGVRIVACDSIRIGHSCMFAHGAYVTDCDWHGIYDRIAIPEQVAPVRIGDNVWIGDRATVLKGVSIGDNSVVAAGSVVASNVAENVVVAGNPAKVIRSLEAQSQFHTRAQYLANAPALYAEFDAWDREQLKANSFWRWIRSLVWPAAEMPRQVR